MLFRRSRSFALSDILDGCRNQKHAAQKQLFEAYYSFGINICLRYADNREEAEEMFDDGFLRVLAKIEYYDPGQSFDAWFRTVIIRSAIAASLSVPPLSSASCARENGPSRR